VHDIPKREIGGLVEVAFRRSVKYEKSSVDLGSIYRIVQVYWGSRVESYAWAPSDRAMKGRKDQSLSTAGSVSFLTPNQLSISGPLSKDQI